jgi:hypothetical protein
MTFSFFGFFRNTIKKQNLVMAEVPGVDIKLVEELMPDMKEMFDLMCSKSSSVEEDEENFKTFKVLVLSIVKETYDVFIQTHPNCELYTMAQVEEEMHKIYISLLNKKLQDKMNELNSE